MLFCLKRESLEKQSGNGKIRNNVKNCSAVVVSPLPGLLRATMCLVPSDLRDEQWQVVVAGKLPCWLLP